MPFGWIKGLVRRRRERPTRSMFRFYDPCCGPTRESLALPSGVRDAAEALDGRCMGLEAALAHLRAAIAPHGGGLETRPKEGLVLWYMPEGGGAHVFYLVRFK